MYEDFLKFDNGTALYWTGGSCGGGSTQYKDFLNVLKENKKTYTRGLEWCAGLGAVGYGILDAKLCETFVFMDRYEQAILDVEYTAKYNNIEDKITTYLCDEIGKIPAKEQFDLVVGNPPHIPNSNGLIDKNETNIRLTVDEDWKIHNEFFCNIGNYLVDGADIFLSAIDIHPEIQQMAIDNQFVVLGEYPSPMLSQTGGSRSVIIHYRYNKLVD